MDKKTLDKLTKMNACTDAMNWLVTQDNAKQAWDNCEDPRWMLWLLGKLSGEVGSPKRKKLVLTVCQCARLSLRFVPDYEHHPEQAICAAEQYALGDTSVSLDDVRDAAYAAYAAVAAAYAAVAADAVAAAAYAAVAAAAYAAVAAAANAVAAAAANAVAAADAAARKETLKKCADIVRTFYPEPPKF